MAYSIQTRNEGEHGIGSMRIVSPGITVNRTFAYKRMPIQNDGIIDLRLVFQNKIQVFLKKFIPWIAVERAEKNCIGMLEVRHAEIASIADRESARYQLR